MRRDECSVCRFYFQVTKKGVMRHHHRYGNRCPGAGKPPYVPPVVTVEIPGVSW